jgi:hypothetical protein
MYRHLRYRSYQYRAMSSGSRASLHTQQNKRKRTEVSGTNNYMAYVYRRRLGYKQITYENQYENADCLAQVEKQYEKRIAWHKSFVPPPKAVNTLHNVSANVSRPCPQTTAAIVHLTTEDGHTFRKCAQELFDLYPENPLKKCSTQSASPCAPTAAI